MQTEPLRIIITGGSSGIGEAIALNLAKDNHNFFLTGRSQQKLEEVVKRVKDIGGRATYGAGDVGDINAVEGLFSQALRDLGGVDVLVANAGVGYFGPLEEMSIEQFDEQFKTNVRGVFLWLRKTLPIMKKQNRGQIVITSSNLGLKTAARTSVYSATKHAVQAMTWCLREELKGTNVKAATLNPGSVATAWFDGKDVDKSKMIRVEEVAKAARLIITQDVNTNIDHVLIGNT